MYDHTMGKSKSEVVERIEELLRLRNMSVADLSRESHLSESALSNILNGKRTQPRSDTIRKIAKGFSTSVDYLYGYTNDPEPSDAPPLPDYAAEVLASMRKLDKGRNYELLLIAEAFVEARESINRLTRQELMDVLADMSDEVAGEEGTDQMLKLLELLEKKWGKRPLLPPPDEPTEPDKNDP